MPGKTTINGEVCGLDVMSGENGRDVCIRHANMPCSAEMGPGSYVYFEYECRSNITGEMEDLIKVYQADGGRHGCVIGYIPRAEVATRTDELNGKYARLVELYSDSDNLTKKRKSQNLQGVASYTFMGQEEAENSHLSD